MTPKWDQRFLALAKHVSSWSRDPSTKTGAVIANGKEVASLGFNGFAPGVNDDPAVYADREVKYRQIIHCEVNAVLLAKRNVTGFTLYTWPFMSCSPCAAVMIRAGIWRCVAPPLPDHLKERWAKDMGQAAQQFADAGVRLDIIELETP